MKKEVRLNSCIAATTLEGLIGIEDLDEDLAEFLKVLVDAADESGDQEIRELITTTVLASIKVNRIPPYKFISQIIAKLQEFDDRKNAVNEYFPENNKEVYKLFKVIGEAWKTEADIRTRLSEIIDADFIDLALSSLIEFHYLEPFMARIEDENVDGFILSQKSLDLTREQVAG